MTVELRLSDRLTLSVVILCLTVAQALDFEHRRFSPPMFSSAFLGSAFDFEQGPHDGSGEQHSGS
jgi:hypothetical protein